MMKPRQFIPVLILVAGIVAYHNSFRAPFIFDDPHAIQENPTIHHLWPIGNVLSPPAANSFVGGRPVLNLSLALCYALGGLGVWWYHAFNLAIHILAGLTLYGIVRRTLLQQECWSTGVVESWGRFGASAEWIALTVALLWTVHPLQTEAVTYIYQRTESLMGLFYLLTLYCFVRGVEGSGSAGASPSKWFVLSVATCFLGMASKEVMVTAPVMVLLYDRTFVSGSFRGACSRHWRLYLGLAGSWLWLGYLMVGLHARGIGYDLGVTGWNYATAECRVFVQYLRLAVWPTRLTLDYGTYVPTMLLTAAPYALILAVLAASVLAALKRQPAIGFLGAWFFVILAPTSSVVPIGDSPMAEHRMYLSLAAVATLVVVGAVALGKRLFGKRQRVILGCVIGGFVVLLLTLLTVQRNQVYHSAVSIWQDAAEKCPNNFRAHYNLGAALLPTRNPANAIAQFEQALRIKPDFSDAQNSLGIALQQAGRVQEAIEHYEQALQIRPRFADAQNNLGIALMEQGRLQEAIGHYEQALRIQPDYAKAQCNWANGLFRAGNAQEAIGHYQQALRMAPDFFEAHFNLGVALEKTGRVQEAIRQFELALRIRPGFVEAQSALARLEAGRQ